MLIGAAAVIALPTVILAFLYGQSRIFFVMARDGLLPAGLARVEPATGTPVRMTVVRRDLGWRSGRAAAAERHRRARQRRHAGRLHRRRAVHAGAALPRAGRARVFRTPLGWIVGPLAIAGCLYLFWNLPYITQTRFFIWNAIGIAVYLFYASRHSILADRAP